MARRKGSSMRSRIMVARQSPQESAMMLVLSLLLLGGMVMLILWLAGVFDSNPMMTTTGAALEESPQGGLLSGGTIAGISFGAIAGGVLLVVLIGLVIDKASGVPHEERDIVRRTVGKPYQFAREKTRGMFGKSKVGDGDEDFEE